MSIMLYDIISDINRYRIKKCHFLKIDIKPTVGFELRLSVRKCHFFRLSFWKNASPIWQFFKTDMKPTVGLKMSFFPIIGFKKFASYMTFFENRHETDYRFENVIFSDYRFQKMLILHDIFSKVTSNRLSFSKCHFFRLSVSKKYRPIWHPISFFP